MPNFCNVGVHCAPGAHATMGTEGDGGTTRLSFGPFVEEAAVRRAAALGAVASASEPPKSRAFAYYSGVDYLNR